MLFTKSATGAVGFNEKAKEMAERESRAQDIVGYYRPRGARGVFGTVDTIQCGYN